MLPFVSSKQLTNEKTASLSLQDGLPDLESYLLLREGSLQMKQCFVSACKMRRNSMAKLPVEVGMDQISSITMSVTEWTPSSGGYRR